MIQRPKPILIYLEENETKHSAITNLLVFYSILQSYNGALLSLKERINNTLLILSILFFQLDTDAQRCIILSKFISKLFTRCCLHKQDKTFDSK